MTIRTGIIGFGASGQIFHSSSIAANPAFSIDAVVTADPGRARIAAERGFRAVSRPEELLAEAGDLDLVVVATPPHTHAQHVLAFLEKGVPVVSDKPFATSSAEAERMVEASAAAGVPVFVYQNRRWDAEFLTARRLLADGLLGRVFRFESSMEKFSGESLRTEWQRGLDAANGGGVLFDLGAHLIDQALQLFGPARLEAAETVSVFPGRASEDEAFVWLRHETGVRSHLAMSRSARRSGPRLRLLGTEGAWSIDAADRQEDQLRAGGRVTDDDYGVTPEADWGVLTTAAGDAAVPAERGDHPAFYRAVATALAGGENTVGPEGPLAALRLIEQAHRLAAQAK